LLLGEKETIAFEASRIADGHGKVSKDVVDALVLAALFESSDRARLQVYRALHALKGRDRTAVAELRMKYLRAAVAYKSGLDLANFCKRLTQLDKAVPWIAEDQSDSPALIRTICLGAQP
jgi:hypothetical protein